MKWIENIPSWAKISGALLVVFLAFNLSASTAQAVPKGEVAATVAVAQVGVLEGGAAESVAVRSDFCSLMPGLCGGVGASSDYNIPQVPIPLIPYGGACTQTDEQACHQECLDGGFMGCGTKPGNLTGCHDTIIFGCWSYDTGVPAAACEDGCDDTEINNLKRQAKGKAPKTETNSGGGVKVPCFSDPEWCKKIGAG